MINKEKFKILFITSWYPHAERKISGIFVKRYVDSISEHCNVLVFHPIPVIDMNEKYKMKIQKDDNVITCSFYYSSKEGKTLIEKLENIIVRYSLVYSKLKEFLGIYGYPDLIHLQVIYPFGWLALFLKYFKKIPYLVTEHSTIYTSSDKYKGILRKYVTKKVVKNAKCITTVSISLRNAMRSFGLENKYYVIPNIVESTFEPGQISNKERIHMLFLGNLKNSHKNIEGIIYALKNVLQLRNDFVLNIVGNGEDKEKLKLITKSLKLTKHINFLGEVSGEKLQNYFKNSDFFILNSNYETFSVATAEALSYGLPVIITRCGGPEEFVKDDMGIIIEPKNQKQLEKALLLMMDNFKNYDRNYLSTYSKSKFHKDMIGKAFVQLYSNIHGDN